MRKTVKSWPQIHAQQHAGQAIFPYYLANIQKAEDLHSSSNLIKQR